MLKQMLKLVDAPNASVDVKSATLAGLYHLDDAYLKALEDEADDTEISYLNFARREMDKILQRSLPPSNPANPLKTPPGSPIGSR